MKKNTHAAFVKKVNSICSELSSVGFVVDHKHKKICCSEDKQIGIKTWGKIDYLIHSSSSHPSAGYKLVRVPK